MIRKMRNPALGIAAACLLAACNSATNASVEVPGAPTSVAAVAGNGQATVYWIPSEKGFSLDITYTATAVQDPDKRCVIAPVTAGFYCVIDGLDNGTAYTFTVTATNSAGTGSASAPSIPPVTPLSSLKSIPDAPESVFAVAGVAQARVTWSLPDDGGFSITGYRVAAVQDSSKACMTYGAYDTTCVVYGLKNGKSYTFVVTASNSLGASVPSVPTAPVIPGNLGPEAPQDVWAEGGDGQATVYWTPPFGNGAVISGFTARAVQDASKSCSAPGDTITHCTVTGLTNGAAYTFTVTATGPKAGTVSAPSNSVTPGSIPGVNWRSQVSGVTDFLYDVVWSGTQLVVVGGKYVYSSASSVLTSPDGVTWTQRTSPGNDYLYSVVWTGGLFVAVGGGSSNAVIQTSPDGVTWTLRSSTATARLRKVIWTGSQLVASGDAGNLLTSPDGITWTKRTVGTSGTLSALVWTGSQLITASWNSTLQSTTVYTSPTGAAWTSRITVKSALWDGGWTGTQTVLVTYDTVVTSQDGVTWTKAASGLDNIQAVRWDGTKLIGVGSLGGASDGWRRYLYSADGTTWQAGGLIALDEWKSVDAVTAMGDKLVAVGHEGDIWISP